MWRSFQDYKREMDARCEGYDKLEKMAAGEVISPKPDLPNVSTGDTAGIVRRMSRNLVQHAPNVEVISVFDDDSKPGILVAHTLRSKIIGSDLYSNDMQQNLFASTKTALTTGFACVLPCLLQDPDGSWRVEYDAIHYRDVFPEPGAKDVRTATDVFVRRYLTKGDIKQLIDNEVPGWDHAALRKLLKDQPTPPPREAQSNAHEDKKRNLHASGYEIITWYSNTGNPFLTFSASNRTLLRIEKNLHPRKWHPVFFLVLEKDDQQPLGKSQVELLLGKQEFQDLMHNGAMKLWYRNINPTILGFGAGNIVPNLGPGKYTQVSNPNARIEAFEVQTQTLSQYPQLSQNMLGGMVNLVGSADQQMATQAGNGMSATPQGIEAQTQMVDITTNNYQKAIESFFSRYCSYALTVYFQELRGGKRIVPNADTRIALLDAGLPEEDFEEDGSIEIDFSELAVEYFVRCVPGSLVEMEDEKQLRILNQLFVPLSQAMPALAAVQDQKVLANAAAAMQFIIEKQIELSGSNRAGTLGTIFKKGRSDEVSEFEERAAALEESIGGSLTETMAAQTEMAAQMSDLRNQLSLMAETQAALLEKLGVPMPQSIPKADNTAPTAAQGSPEPTNITDAGA